MHFYKPVTYTVKSFSILEQAVLLLGPIACCRFIKLKFKSDISLQQHLLALLWGPEFNTTSLKKTKLVSEFNNFKINFSFTLKCSCQCKQSTFQFLRAAGQWYTITATPWQHPWKLMLSPAPFVSLIQSQARRPWPVSNPPKQKAVLRSCISHIRMD